MEAIFHVGTHKTGTTSFQRYLTKLRAGYRELEILYPDYNELIETNVRHYAHLDLAKSITENTTKFLRSEILEMFKSINNLSSKQTVLLSSEPFWRIGFDRDSKNPVSDKKRLLLPYFSLIDNCIIGISLRLKSDFILSMYSENILQTTNTWSINEFINKNKVLFDYTRNVELWSSMGKVRMCSYEKAAKSGNLGYYMLNCFTANENKAISNQPTPYANTSRPLPYLFYKLYLNRQGYSKKEGLRVIDLLNKNINLKNEASLRCLQGKHWLDYSDWSHYLDKQEYFSLLSTYSTDSIHDDSDIDFDKYALRAKKYTKLRKIDAITLSDFFNRKLEAIGGLNAC